MSGYRFCVNVVTAGFLAAAGSAGWLGLVATAAADPGGGGSSSHDSGGSHSSASGSQRSGGSGASGSAGPSSAQHGGGTPGGSTGAKSSGGADAPGHSAATKPKAPSGSHSADSPAGATKHAGASGGAPTKEKRALTDPKPGTSKAAPASGVAGEPGASGVGGAAGSAGPAAKHQPQLNDRSDGAVVGGGVGRAQSEHGAAPGAEHKPGGKPASTPPGHTTKTGEHGSTDSNVLHPKHVEGRREDAKGGQHTSPSNAAGWTSHDSGVSLSPEQNAAANRFLEQARQAEPHITQSLRGMVDSAPGSQFIGLADRLKTEESFKRKFSTFILTNPKLSTAEHLEDMRDSVRYTVQLPHDLYTATTQRTIDRLFADGYEPVRLTNTWGQPGYQGFNSAWREPKTGHTFEVQFHTPASFDAKTQTHFLYEEERLPDTPPQRVSELQKEKGRVFDSVPRPSGSSSISLSPNGKRK